MSATGSQGTETVSVVVPTRNSAKTLEACLASIRGQTYSAVELIVVDNFSFDATPDIARRYAHVFEQAGPERSAQRNRGAQLASGAYLLMIDSDMVLGERIVGDCVDAALSEGAAAIVIPERSVGDGFWAACKALERSCYVGDETVEAARFFVKSSFEEHEGYDEEMTGPEDWDLPARMRAGGARISRIDAEIVHLEGALTLRDTMAKKFYYGRQLGPYLSRHPALARRQLFPLRRAFIRQRGRLVRRPLLASGMLFMKTAELTAGALGVASARLADALDRRALVGIRARRRKA